MADSGVSVCCDCTPVAEVEYEAEDHQSPSMAVVEAVAAAEGVPPTEIEPVSRAVDPEAVDRLFDGDRPAAERARTLAFATDDWNVFVRGDGAIRVCDPDGDSPAGPAFEKPVVE